MRDPTTEISSKLLYDLLNNVPLIEEVCDKPFLKHASSFLVGHEHDDPDDIVTLGFSYSCPSQFLFKVRSSDNVRECLTAVTHLQWTRTIRKSNLDYHFEIFINRK